MLENMKELRESHNKTAFESKEKCNQIYHYVAYVPNNGKVYELDGLRAGPTLIDFIEEGKDWVLTAKDEIQSKCRNLLEHDSDFHLFILIPDKKYTLESGLKRDKAIKCEIERRINLHIEEPIDPIEIAKYKDVMEKLPDDKTALQSMHTIVKTTLIKVEQEIKAEEDRRKKVYQECLKRTHNYLKFLFEFLQAMNKNGILNTEKTKSLSVKPS